MSPAGNAQRGPSASRLSPSAAAYIRALAQAELRLNPPPPPTPEQIEQIRVALAPAVQLLAEERAREAAAAAQE